MQLNLTEDQKIRNKRIWNIVCDISYFIFLISLAFCLLSYLVTWKQTGIPNVLGYRHFYIASGSMEPTINTTQFVMTKTVDVDEIEVGDIIAYKNQSMGKIIIHRVVEVKELGNNEKAFICKGDNNEKADPYDVTEDMVMYEVVWY